MTRKELIEAIARAMAECEPRSLYGDAVAALSAIEGAGVRLVPVDAVMEQMPEVKLPMDVDLFCNTMLTCGDLYNAMVAASPFAPPVEAV